MKAYKRQIINHITAGKPFMYKQHRFSNPHYVFIATPYDVDNVAESKWKYSMKSSWVKRDGKLADTFQFASLRISTTGIISILLGIGDLIVVTNMNIDKIILLDKNYKTITK